MCSVAVVVCAADAAAGDEDDDEEGLFSPSPPEPHYQLSK